MSEEAPAYGTQTVMRVAPLRGARRGRISPIDLAYLAGIIDGEGYIGVTKDGYLRVVIANTDQRLVRWLCRVTGFGTTRISRRGGNRRTAYFWLCFGPEARNLLLDVAPYLVLKAEQARAGVESQRGDGDIEVARAELSRLKRNPPSACRSCGCTDENCSGCVEKTGEPCTWVETDLCSACVDDA